MKYCDDCGQRLGGLKEWIFGDVPECECKSQPQEEEDPAPSHPNIKITSNIPREDMPPEIRKVVDTLGDLIEDDDNAHLIAVDMMNLEKENPELYAKLRVLKAREDFGKAAVRLHSMFHELHHAGIADSELKITARQWARLTRELVCDYLWFGEQEEDHKSEQEIFDMIDNMCFNCKDEDHA